MAQYVIRRFSQDGRLLARVDAECDADDDAVSLLHEHLGDSEQGEVWCGVRHVARHPRAASDRALRRRHWGDRAA